MWSCYGVFCCGECIFVCSCYGECVRCVLVMVSVFGGLLLR